MKTALSRREFLKLAALLPAKILLSRLGRNPLLRAIAPQKKNVLIIVFDTWSAKHLSLFGYPRHTSPQLESLAEKAIVYHNHYAAAPWTVPGTASMLTGLYPWDHRVFGTDRIKYCPNLFGIFGEAGYHIQSYTHNPLANRIIQAYASPDQVQLRPETFFLAKDPTYNKLVERDEDAYRLARYQIFLDEDNVDNSLFLGRPLRAALDLFYHRVLAPYADQYSKEPPVVSGSRNYFVLDDPFNWIVETLPISPQPFVHYYHFLPPHAPYHPRLEFEALFEDGWEHDKKPFQFPGEETQRKINRNRKSYDRFVADVDDAFAHLYRGLEQSGLLDDTWIVLTSDHGELFERGLIGHTNITLFEPLVNVPLLVFPPQSTSRVDIYDRTSAVDLLPTLLHLTGQPALSGLPGKVIPPFNKDYEGMPRRIFTMNPKHSDSEYQMSEGTIALLKDEFQLVYYFGHEEMGDVPKHLELYDLVNDPEELDNLYTTYPDRAAQMWAILQEQMDRAESLYPSPK